MGRPFFFPDLEMQVAGFNTVGRAYLSDILALPPLVVRIGNACDQELRPETLRSQN